MEIELNSDLKRNATLIQFSSYQIRIHPPKHVRTATNLVHNIPGLALGPDAEMPFRALHGGRPVSGIARQVVGGRQTGRDRVQKGGYAFRVGYRVPAAHEIDVGRARALGQEEIGSLAVYDLEEKFRT